MYFEVVLLSQAHNYPFFQDILNNVLLQFQLMMNQDILNMDSEKILKFY